MNGTEFAVIIGLPIVICIVNYFNRAIKREKEMAVIAEVKRQQLLKEKDEFDRGYYHGFQDGVRDARNIAYKSLYNPQGSELYIEGYSCGYKAGAIFDHEIEDCEDFYPEKYKNVDIK